MAAPQTRRDTHEGATDLTVTEHAAAPSVPSLRTSLAAQPARRRPGHASDLVGALAHEVRGALATMQVSLEVLADIRSERADQAYLVGHLQRCVAWVEGLLDNTHWAATDFSPAALCQEPISVLEPVQAAIALVEPLLAQKRQHVELIAQAPAPQIFGDSQRLGQVLVNLFTNACAYGLPGDTLVVEFSTIGDRVEVRVTDHGPGIALDEQDRIFDRYVRGQAAASGRVRGLGIGLHLAKTLIESHGGTIGVDSVPGCGASFWFQLPIWMPSCQEPTELTTTEVTRK